MRSIRRAAPILLVSAVYAACSSDHANPLAGVNRPQVTSLSVGPNPLNALSVIVAFTATGGDSARVTYSTPGDTTAATPFVPLHGDSGRIVTLGLLPSANYNHVLEIVGPGGRLNESFQVSTGALPAYIQTASLTINGTFGRGYTLVSPILFTGDSVVVLAFDSKGRVRWYRTFPPGTGSVDSKQQTNGHFTIALGGSTGGDGVAEEYDEFLPSGEVVATYTAPAGEFTDSHEMLMTGPVSNPMLHLFGYTSRPFDFSPLGGPSNGTGFGHQLIRESPPGTAQIIFDSWDHFSIADWIEPTGVNPPNDFDHPNSLDFDLDSNYIVSFRHLGAIVKLDAQTGAKIWQLGGRLGQFTIKGDPQGFFSGQHCVRVLPNGHLLLYDNGLRHSPPHTRAVEYALDVAHKTATMVWEYEPSPMIFTPIVGSVQRLSDGKTLVGFGVAGQIHEVDSTGHAAATAVFLLHQRGSFYRAIRIASLYQYERP